MPASTERCGACRDGAESFPFTMAFQPVVDVVAERIDAQEALVRGVNGEGAGTILAQVNDDNRYAFDQSCRVRAIELAAKLGLDRTLNINFMPNAVYDPRACIRLTLDAAQRTGFPLDHLTFEFVEQENMNDLAHLKNIITEYRRHGFRIALDDFGTAFSGLHRLIELQPDIIKLDRALIVDCDGDRTRQAIVRNMTSMGAQLGTKVVVEGVERREEYETLRALGVRYMQGFYFCKPRFEAIATDAELFPHTAKAAQPEPAHA